MALILLSIGFGFLGTVPGDRSDWLFFLDTAVHWVWFLDFLVMCQVTGVIGCFSLILLFIGYGSSISWECAR